MLLDESRQQYIISKLLERHVTQDVFKEDTEAISRLVTVFAPFVWGAILGHINTAYYSATEEKKNEEIVSLAIRMAILSNDETQPEFEAFQKSVLAEFNNFIPENTANTSVSLFLLGILLHHVVSVQLGYVVVE